MSRLLVTLVGLGLLSLAGCGTQVEEIAGIDSEMLQGTWCLQTSKSAVPQERILAFVDNQVTVAEYLA